MQSTEAACVAIGADEWAARLNALAQTLYPSSDPSHDILHIRRVVHTAQRLAAAEGADMMVVTPAAWLHDCVTVTKNDPRRTMASRLSADAALEHLAGMGYPSEYFPAIHHAIAAHSFSAGIAPESLEAKVVQDADRLDGLGAIGIARCFTVGSLLGRPFYFDGDILAQNRTPDDLTYTLDHFFVKLFKTAETLQTKAGQVEGARRAAFMHEYLQAFAREAGEQA